MRLIIFRQSSNTSLRLTNILPASRKHRFSESAQQWTGIPAGCCSRKHVATPDLLPCILVAPSYACPRQRASGRFDRRRRSLIMKRVSALISGTLYNPKGSSCIS